MTTVKRVARYPDGDGLATAGFWEQALRDMAAGKHAVDCACWLPIQFRREDDAWRPNACSTIAARALAFEDYEIEGEE
jgi:hypothetical protein